jgi:predicted acetyltransferase
MQAKCLKIDEKRLFSPSHVVNTMDTIKEQIRRIYYNAFSDNPSWNRRFFDLIYRKDEAMLLTKGDKPVSCLLLQKYQYKFYGSPVPMAYVSGAATDKLQRGNGYMSELMADALRAAYDRGDVLATLIPATEGLFSFYKSFGFATVFYLDCERYTSMHKFERREQFTPVEAIYDDFAELEQLRNATVMHSERDFDLIIADNLHDNGVVRAVANADDNTIAAMAFAVSNGKEVVVRELLAVSAEAAEAVLAEVKEAMPELPMLVWAMPTKRDVQLRARGMCRIISVHEALRRLAAANPQIEQTVRVHDNRITENEGIYVIGGGRCERVDSTQHRITLEADVSTLASIMFSPAAIGEIFKLPTERGMLPLMLD